MLALEQSDYAAAETLFAAYRDQHERMSSPVSDAMGRAYNQNGLILVELGRPDESLPLLRDAVAIWNEVHGPVNEHTSTALNNIGYAFGSMSEQDSAYAYNRAALAMRQRLYDGDHPLIAASLLNLGANRMLAREYALADSMLVASAAMYERTSGTAHRKTMQALFYVVRNRMRSGTPADLAAAGPTLDDVLARQIQALGADHADVASTYRTRGRLRAMQNDYRGAVADLNRAVALSEARFGLNHSRTRDYLRVRARVHGQFERYDRAEADFADVVRRTRADDAIARDPNFHARTLWDRSGLRMVSGRASESLPDLREAAQIWGELGDDRSVADVRARIAEIEANDG